jgi:nucleotide-binding universal stress UspA family protein
MVFGDDGSPTADLAWLWINSHAWPDWRLEVVHATDPVVVTASAFRPQPRPWRPAHPRQMFAEAQLDEIELLTVDEDPRVALLRPADLLVVGPRGRGFLKAMHVGSTAEWLMTSPSTPMIVVRHGRPTRTVVVCHDGSANACAATRALSRMPWAPGLTVTVVVVDDGRADADAAIEHATSTLGGTGATVRSLTLHGDPIDQLLRHLGQHEPDLVVLGSSSLTGVQRLALESPANVVAHSTHHSILLACERIEVVTEASSGNEPESAQ